jgi:hypothetical protein
LIDLDHELHIYIGNVQADERFAGLDGIPDLGKLFGGHLEEFFIFL